MKNNQKKIHRREFLENIGKAAGSSVMFRAFLAMGLGSSISGCGSSSAESSSISNGSSINSSSQQPFSLGDFTSQKSPRPGDWPVNSGTGSL